MTRLLTISLLALCLLGSVSCASSPGLALDDTRGGQWVWPHFAKRQPTVLAFWDCDNIESIEAMPALNTLNDRESGVQLVTVCVARDRARANDWLRRQRAKFVVLVDEDRKLANRLGITSFPAYVYYNTRAEEVQRYLNIQSAWKFFDLPRFLEKGWVESGP